MDLTPRRMEEILDAVVGVQVLVVGDLMLDHYISGSVDRVSPEAPVPVVHVRRTSSAVGGAGNVSANAVSLGARCNLVGCVGDDGHGMALRQALEEMGVTLDGVLRVPDRPTTTKTRILAGNHQIVRFDEEVTDPVPAAVAEGLLSMVRLLIQDADVVVLQDYNKGVLVPSVIRGTLQAAREHGIPSVVDPKFKGFFDFEGATVFKPNRKELGDALGQPVETDDDEWLESVRKRLGCRDLLVTLGADGMVLKPAERPGVRLPTMARSVFDVSGAGDTVTAVVACALAAGATPEEAAIMANHAAGVEVTKSGVAVVSPREILHHASTTQTGGTP